MKQLTKNFHRSEFDCKDGTIVPQKYKHNLIRLAVNLQKIRDKINEGADQDYPIIIISGYRTKKHNEREGGATNSKHLTAIAGDLYQERYTAKKFHSIIEDMMLNGEIINGGLGLYDTTCHYDVRNYPARWDYSTK